jgi:two-component system sensor histidine kinase CpxA
VTVRGKLFIKIFFGFWLVTIAILGSWMIAARYFESIPPTSIFDNPEGPPPRFMKQLIYDLQNRSEEKLPEMLRGAKRNHKFEIYLLKRDGVDLYGRKLPPGVSEVGDKIHGRMRRAFLKTPDSHMFGHRIYRSEHGPLKAVMVFKPPRPDILTTLGNNIWLRVSLAVLISGLVCFLLSRAVTNRIKQLSHASRHLSEGNFATRIDVREHGGDETDELARDFNSMARRIEQQIEVQKRLLGDVSHELRSPLARLRIALALAQEDTDNSTAHLQRIDREAERLD